jgi:hypothetical protein
VAGAHAGGAGDVVLPTVDGDEELHAGDDALGNHDLHLLHRRLLHYDGLLHNHGLRRHVHGLLHDDRPLHNDGLLHHHSRLRSRNDASADAHRDCSAHAGVVVVVVRVVVVVVVDDHCRVVVCTADESTRKAINRGVAKMRSLNLHRTRCSVPGAATSGRSTDGANPHARISASDGRTGVVVVVRHGDANAGRCLQTLAVGRRK